MTPETDLPPSDVAEAGRHASAGCAPTSGSEVCAGDGYRLLEPGERLQKHDEGLHEEDGQWHAVGWLFSSCDFIPGFMVPIRRKIDPQNPEVCDCRGKPQPTDTDAK